MLLLDPLHQAIVQAVRPDPIQNDPAPPASRTLRKACAHIEVAALKHHLVVPGIAQDRADLGQGPVH
ncbi:MAG: hypothetical protein ACREA0_02220 [bacterium]